MAAAEANEKQQVIADEEDEELFDDDNEVDVDDEGLHMRAHGRHAEYMLGFVEKVAPTVVLRHQFPSKVGGRPAWLDPVHLPTKEQLTCKASGKHLNFLLQVYAPLDDDFAHEAAFHRSLFMFITPQGKLVNQPGAVRVYRCQLPRANPYYPFHPPTSKDIVPQPLQADDHATSLAVDPWKVLEAEAALASKAMNKATEGKKGDSDATTTAADGLADLNLNIKEKGLKAGSGSNASLTLFPEAELLVEPEEREPASDAASVQRVLQDYEAKVADEGELTEEELPAEVIQHIEEAEGAEDRAHFAMFQARMELAPDQVIRYCFRDGAHALWPNLNNIPSPSDIPACPHCKQPRKFEFQVMPQLLNELDQDELSDNALDWSTIAVYSCPISCDAGTQAAMKQGSAYVEEFAWVQPA